MTDFSQGRPGRDLPSHGEHRFGGEGKDFDFEHERKTGTGMGMGTGERELGGMPPHLREQDSPQKKVGFEEESKAEYNVQKYHHGIHPHSFFYLTVNGQIEFGQFRELDGISVKFDFITGSDWKFVDDSGALSGVSQHSFKSGGFSQRIVWNFPFELTYRSLNPHGWPQLVLTCSGKDFLGREINYAYGCIHVPTQPGRHERYARMFSPVSSSAMTRFFAWFSGRYAEYFNAPKLIAKAEGREVTRVKSGGIVKIIFQVSHRDMDAFGYFNN